MKGEIGKLYDKLQQAVADYASKKITYTQYYKIISELNNNEFGIVISSDLVVDGESELNHPDTSYEQADTSYDQDESYDDDEDEDEYNAPPPEPIRPVAR